MRFIYIPENFRYVIDIGRLTGRVAIRSVVPVPVKQIFLNSNWREEDSTLGPRERHIMKKRLAILLWLLLVLFLLLSVATYTWFSLSKTPIVSDMYLYVNSNTGFELSWTLDENGWGQHLDFADVQTDMIPLKPVTYSYKEDTFYAARFGFDGRIADIEFALDDDRNANRDDSDGYYLKTAFYGRTGEKVTVSLMPAAASADKQKGTGTYLIGTPLWNTDALLHENGGSNAECAVRIGFRITKTDTQGNPLGDKSIFYIYEPNYDRHLDGGVGYRSTPSIDGTENLVPGEYLILQTASSWSEMDPVQRSAILYTFGEFDTDVTLFQLSPEELVYIEVYVWLEGQDVDCINTIGQSAQLFANIQFDAEAETQSGLEPIK